MSKQSIESLLARKAQLSLRQIMNLCSEDVTVAGEGADSSPRRQSDVHVAAYLAAHNVAEHEPLEAYGLGLLGLAEQTRTDKAPSRPTSTVGPTSNAPHCKIVRVFRPWRFAIWGPLLLASAIAVLLAAFISPHPFGNVLRESQTYTDRCAPQGEHEVVPLPDGTTVDLNSGTCAKVTFSAKERFVRLESGEAVFQVTPDRNRPFTVKVGHVQIRVLGTRFDVLGGAVGPYTRERSTRIVVLAGAIEITRDDTSSQSIMRLTASDQIEIPDDRTKTGSLRHITVLDAGRMTAWQHGELEFEDRPLKEIVAEFARYQSIQVVTNDPEILHQRYTGSFRTTDVTSFLRVLSANCIHSTYEDEGRRIVLSRSTQKGNDRSCKFSF